MEKFCIELASTYMPSSYDLNSIDIINAFLQDSNDNTYIAKTEIEDTKGLLVSKNKMKPLKIIKLIVSFKMYYESILN